MRLPLTFLAAILLALMSLHAAERMIPVALAEGSYNETTRARQNYKQAPNPLKTWDATRALPTNWLETGLSADAKLVFTEEVIDGGSRAFCFKDTSDQYFVFCLSAPLMRGDSGQVVRSDPVFYVGAFHASEPGAIRVPVDSAAEKFLIGILQNVVDRRPPKALPPRGPGWTEMSQSAVSEVRAFTEVQRSALRMGVGALYVLQSTTPEILHKLPTDELISRLSKAPNPLRRGEPNVVVSSCRSTRATM